MSGSISGTRLWCGFKTYVGKFWRWLKDSSAQISALAAVIGLFAAIIGLFLVAYQLHQASSSARNTNKTGQVQFSLQVMQRLDEVLGMIAADPDCYKYIWVPSESSAPAPGSKEVQCGDSLLDVLSVVMKAVTCLPNFASNKHEWDDYVQYQFNMSPNLGKRVTEKPWWPELNQFVPIPDGGASC